MQSFPLAFCMIVFRHTVGLLWTSDQPVSETSTCTGQHNIETQETNIHALSGIRTRDPSNQAAEDLRLRSRGYRGQPCQTNKLKYRNFPHFKYYLCPIAVVTNLRFGNSLEVHKTFQRVRRKNVNNGLFFMFAV
jgi:hypothetical protein